MSRRSRLFNRTSLHWLELIFLLALVLGVLVVINYIAYRHNERYDLTPEKSFSLAPHTMSTLASLTDDLDVTIFFKTKQQAEFLELTSLFARASERFHYTFVDLDKNPARARALGISSYGAGIVEYQGRREKLQHFSEEGLVSAIIRLTEKDAKLVRFVRGHGEKDIASGDAQQGFVEARRALEAENFRIEELLLAQTGTVPADTLILVIAGAQKDFLTPELETLTRYLESGGNVLLLCDPVRLPALTTWLGSLGVTVTTDFVIDTKSKLMALDYLTPIATPDKRHPVGRSLNQAVVLPYTRSVIPADTIKTQILAMTGPESWAERDYQSVYDGTVSFDPGTDLQGPVPVALSVTVEGDAAAGKLVVIGDSDFANNHYLSILGNRDFLLNLVNWMAGSGGRRMDMRIRPQQSPVSMLFLTENESRLVFWSTVIIQPALILLVGLAVALWRRFKQ